MLMRLFFTIFSAVFIATGIGCTSISDNSNSGSKSSSIFKKFANSLPETLRPYQVDIIQGNHITDEMVLMLEKGLTKVRVQGILGTPLIVDPFREDRWDYTFMINRGSSNREIFSLSLRFEGGKLISWAGDTVSEEFIKYRTPVRKF